MEWHDWAHLLVQIGPALIALGLVAAFGKKAVAKIKGAWKNWIYMWTDRERHDEIQRILNEVAAELKPNGGTSIKDAIQRIERKQEFFWSFRRAQINTVRQAMAETDAKGQIIWVNRAFVRLTGSPEKDALGSGWVNIFDPSQRAWFESLWQRTVDAAREFSEDLVILHPNGTKLEIHMTAHPIISSDNVLFGYLVEIADCPITDCPRAISTT